MIERQLDVPTPDGATTTFICHPERGGPHAPILFFMDAPAIREELRDMARRLGTMGYYVALPNLYYRAGVMELGSLTEPGARERMGALMNGLTIDMVMSDAEALIAFIDADPAARPGAIGALGYCMSGQFAVNAAGRFPNRIAAAASFYGTYLVTGRPDSPHLMAARARGAVYVAFAETDRWAPPETIAAFQAAAAPLAPRVEVEVYPGTDHGFAFPQRAVYDKAAAERHWERLAALFHRGLG
jgi:carboxymethylenebutenolidase